MKPLYGNKTGYDSYGSRVGYDNHDIVSRLKTLKECGRDAEASPTVEDIARAVCNTYGSPDANELSRLLENALAQTKSHAATTARGRVRATLNWKGPDDDKEAIETILRSTIGKHMLPPTEKTIDELIELLKD